MGWIEKNPQYLTQEAIHTVMTQDHNILPETTLIDAILVCRLDTWKTPKLQGSYPNIPQSCTKDTMYLEVPKGWKFNIQPNIPTEIIDGDIQIYRFSPLLAMPRLPEEVKQKLPNYPFNHILQLETYTLQQKDILHTITWYEFEIQKGNIKQYQLGEMSMEIIKQ